MDRFEKYVKFIIDEIEGGYINHPDDPGGATRYGITEAVARKEGYNGKMQDFPYNVAVDIYRAKYWTGTLAEAVQNDLSFHLFDCNINSGEKNTIKILQKSLMLPQDGQAGPETFNALSQYSEKVTILRFCVARMDYFARLSTFKSFGRGWCNRLLLLSEVKF